MALKDQPYLPLFVDDFLADEKLSLCSAESTGVYIRLMCLMHKSDEYGVISLSKLDKKGSSQIENFSALLSKQMPYENDVIFRSISELFERKVVQIKGDKLFQKRMVNDSDLSKKRAIAGSKGGKQNSSKATSKTEANTGIGIVIVNEYENKENTCSEVETISAREALSRVITMYRDKITASPSMTVVELLKAYTEDFGADVVCRAIEIAIDENARKWSFIRAILQNWTREKVKCLADVDRLQAERAAAKNYGSAQRGSPATNNQKKSITDILRERGEI